MKAFYSAYKDKERSDILLYADYGFSYQYYRREKQKLRTATGYGEYVPHVRDMRTQSVQHMYCAGTVHVPAIMPGCTALFVVRS